MVSPSTNNFTMDGTGESLDMSGTYNHIGQQFSTGHILVGETVTNVQFYLKVKAPNTQPSQDVTCSWYNEGETLQVTSDTTYDISGDFTTSFAFKNFVFNYTVTAGDFCAVTTTPNLDASKGKLSFEGGADEYANTAVVVQTGGSWQYRDNDLNSIWTY